MHYLKLAFIDQIIIKFDNLQEEEEVGQDDEKSKKDNNEKESSDQ